MNSKETGSDTIKPLEHFGTYEILICIMVCLSKFSSGWVILASVFLTAPVGQTCVEPNNLTDVCDNACTKIEYNRSVFKQNIIIEWGLICDRDYLARLTQTIVILGIMSGGLLAGLLADKFGRRLVFVIACTLKMVCGLLVSIASFFWLFCLLRYADAFFTGGMMIVSFVIIVETANKPNREVMCMVYQIPFNLAHATLPLFAYFLRDWRWYHFGFSISSIFYLIYWCIIPESTRWLFITGNLDKSIATLEAAARHNRKPTEAIRAEIEEAHKRLLATARAKSSTPLDLFRSDNMLLKTFVMGFNWFVVCLVYFGVVEYVASLTANVFVNVALSGWLMLPGTIISIPATKFMGRKLTLFISNMVSAVALLSLATIPADASGHTFGDIDMFFAIIGLCGASMTFPCVYLFSGELFPTVVRGSGVGFSSFLGGFGFIAAPFVAEATNSGLWIPALIFGGFSLFGAVSLLLLPETKGQPLPDTIEDCENLRESK